MSYPLVLLIAGEQFRYTQSTAVLEDVEGAISPALHIQDSLFPLLRTCLTYKYDVDRPSFPSNQSVYPYIHFRKTYPGGFPARPLQLSWL